MLYEVITLGSGYETCTSVSCHSNGLDGLPGDSPIWGDDTAGCAACHESDMTTGSHGVHITETDCGTCHPGAVKDTTPPTGHTDGDVDVAATYNTANAPIGMASWTFCTNASCHDDGRAPNTTYDWGTTINDCSECHATQPGTGSHTAHVTAGATCGDCHTDAIQGSIV